GSLEAKGLVELLEQLLVEGHRLVLAEEALDERLDEHRAPPALVDFLDVRLVGGELGSDLEVVQLEGQDLIALLVGALDVGVPQLAGPRDERKLLEDFHGGYSTGDSDDVKNFSSSSRSRLTRQSGRLASTSAP